MSQSTEEVLVDIDSGVMVITINRPEQRNAMTQSAGRMIAAALDRLDAAADIAVAVLTGSGGTFCAGMDLKRFIAGETAIVPGRGFGGLTESVPAKPLIAAVEGYAVGGGFEMVLSCDLVVAAQNAQFGLPEVRRGLVAKAGGLFRLQRCVSRNVALELILTGEMLSAVRGESLGLINRVVPEGHALDAARTLAKTIAANAPLALTASKRVVAESLKWSGGEEFARQSAIVDPVFTSQDAKEGASAFAEKRSPRWTGR